jgi:hypothetical protein
MQNAIGQNRMCQIAGIRSVRKHSAHIETLTQVGNLEGDTGVGAAPKQAVVAFVGRKSGYALLAKVRYKTSDPVSQAIVAKLSSIASLVKALTFTTTRNLRNTAGSMQPFNPKRTLPAPSMTRNRGLIKTLMAYYDNTSRKRDYLLL